MSFLDFKSISNDKTFENNAEEKLTHYANQFPALVKSHPMSLIYCCAPSDDVNDCVKLVAKVSAHDNHAIIKPTAEDILSVVDFVMGSTKSNIEIKYEAKKKYIGNITGIRLIFFKVCNERTNFNREQLVMMLNYKLKVEQNVISQHDASVDVGTVLVDKYVKSKIVTKETQ